ncbi:MAG TPA: hypothetical protein ENK44_11430 [Caldithrix abyssi]|uniref:Histidine kinase domain-containing protein n=1 Tax=Caldithrix abyssi TaxID=187145 RepID=A0A7V4U1V5_CALAY|nr:hypothetical protein [Caldithrix abyssi]
MIGFIKKNIYWGILILLLWGFFYLLKAQRFPAFTAPFLLGLAYAFGITLTLYFLHRMLLNRLHIFSFRAQWILKSILYACGIFIGYLFIQIPETLLFTPYRIFLDNTIYGFFRGLTFLFTAPLSGNDPGRIISPDALATLVSFTALLILIALTAFTLSYVETRWRMLNLERQQQQTRLKVLEMQMQPHFLFNTLNSIVSIVQKEPAAAEKLLIHLSDFLRYNFAAAEKQFATVAEEIEFAEHYLKLMSARYNGSIGWEIDVSPECARSRIPVMLLQPLVENSVKHGMSEDHPLHIRITCSVQDKTVTLHIQDNGVGLASEDIKSVVRPGHSLDIIRQRLKLLYADKAGFDMRSDRGTEVTVTFPEG